MANPILIKRSSVASKVPATTDLQLGELAINTYDGKLYLKKNNGAESIVDLTLDSTKLPLDGSAPMTGMLGTVGSRFFESTGTAGLHLNNSDIVGVNGIYFADPVDGIGEGINFFRDSTHWDTLSMVGGGLYIQQNRSNNATGSNIRVLDASNYHTYALPLSGGTISGSLFTTSAVGLNGATGSYSGYSCGLTLNYTGSSTQYGITLKPTGSTADTNAITFLTSGSTYASATTLGAIQHLNGDAGMNLSGTWRIGGLPIASTSSSISGTAANVTGVVAIANGGTGATTAEAAIDNLGGVRINPTTPKDGDIQVAAGPTISIYASGAWRQIFPAVYS